MFLKYQKSQESSEKVYLAAWHEPQFLNTPKSYPSIQGEKMMNVISLDDLIPMSWMNI
jgi:hypothetical protein